MGFAQNLNPYVINIFSVFSLLSLSLSLSLSLFAHLVGIAHVTASLNYLPISAQMAKAQGFTVVYWRNKSH